MDSWLQNGTAERYAYRVQMKGRGQRWMVVWGWQHNGPTAPR